MDILVGVINGQGVLNNVVDYNIEVLVEEGYVIAS